MAVITGMDNITRRIRQQVSAIDKRTARGLVRGGLLIRREGQKLTPVDTSNLINSWYGPVVIKKLSGVVVEIGLTASYAPFIHESVGRVFRKRGAQAKFLEQPLKQYAKAVMTILKKDVTIKRGF